eukprot:678795-Pelagomonas_calceolata.AAC.1
MSGREDTGEDARRSQSPPAPSTAELHCELHSGRGKQSGFQAGQQALQPGGYQGKGRGNPSKKAR